MSESTNRTLTIKIPDDSTGNTVGDYILLSEYEKLRSELEAAKKENEYVAAWMDKCHELEAAMYLDNCWNCNTAVRKCDKGIHCFTCGASLFVGEALKEAAGDITNLDKQNEQLQSDLEAARNSITYWMGEHHKREVKIAQLKQQISDLKSQLRKHGIDNVSD